MHKTGLYVFFVASLVVPVVSAVNDGSLSPFGTDKRLNKVIPLTLKDRPASEILGFISKSTGVPLSSDEEVGTLRASLLMKGQTAGIALQALANCLRLSWKKEQNGYRLYRLPEVAQEDQNRAAADAVAYARALGKREEKHRQLTGFVEQVLTRSHLTDDEVWELAAQYPHAAEMLTRSPWNVVAVRVASWLTPEQWEKAIDGGVYLDYDEWMLTGPDSDIPSPQTSPMVSKKSV